jgi:DnaJ-class molecular chaperone
MWGLCPECHGYGLVETARQVMLDIPTGIRHGSRHELALDSVGMNNLTLMVTVLIT